MLNFSVKYRPKNFDEFFGNQKIVNELRKRSIENSIPNVIYFTGLSGTGKTTLDLIIAKVILCENRDEKGNPCDKCQSCETINNEKDSLFFFHFNCSNIDIDATRAIEELAITRTLSNIKKKVIILDELQELYSNAKARKNLLKVLERQNKNTYFILCSMDDSKVDKAIRDRAVTYRLNSSTTSDLAKYLKFICDSENVKLDTKEKIQIILSIAEFCGGSFRQGISLLERVVYSNLWTEKEIQEELNVISQDLMTDMINKIIAEDLSVFNNSFNKDLIDKIIPVLLLTYKRSKGIELEAWQKNQISKINSCDSFKMENLLNALFELNKFTYTTNSLVDFYILKNMNTNIEIPKRRKVAE